MKMSEFFVFLAQELRLLLFPEVFDNQLLQYLVLLFFSSDVFAVHVLIH